MSWDSIKEKSSKYVKIAAGKSARLHFLGEPDERVVHFVDNKYSPCTDGDCALCQQGKERIDRFAVSVFNMEKKISQIFEGPVSIIVQIRTIRDAYNKNIEGLDFMVNRSEGSPAKYTVVPVPTLFHPSMLKEKAVEDAPF